MPDFVYCPSHLTIHSKDTDGSVWCTTDDHIEIGHFYDAPPAAAEARRHGFTFYHGDVVNLRDSADTPMVGDVVGDRKHVARHELRAVSRRLAVYEQRFLREVVRVAKHYIQWKRPGTHKVHECLRETWAAWAKGSWRCNLAGLATRPAE